MVAIEKLNQKRGCLLACDASARRQQNKGEFAIDRSAEFMLDFFDIADYLTPNPIWGFTGACGCDHEDQDDIITEVTHTGIHGRSWL